MWIVIGLNILGGIVTAAVIYGKTATRMDSLENRQDEFAKHHEDHYNHAGNREVHWTTRERDTLNEILRDMQKDLKDLVRRGNGVNGK